MSDTRFSSLVDHLGEKIEASAGKSPKDPPKKKDRPAGTTGESRSTATRPDETGPAVSVDQLSPLVRVVFNLFLERMELEPLNTSEAKELAGVYKPVMDKYVPWIVGEYGLEIAAVGVTLTVLSPRWSEWRLLQEQRREQSQGDGLPIQDLESDTHSGSASADDGPTTFPAHVMVR